MITGNLFTWMTGVTLKVSSISFIYISISNLDSNRMEYLKYLEDSGEPYDLEAHSEA
jgi:hypothetical protein